MAPIKGGILSIILLAFVYLIVVLFIYQPSDETMLGVIKLSLSCVAFVVFANLLNEEAYSSIFFIMGFIVLFLAGIIFFSDSTMYSVFSLILVVLITSALLIAHLHAEFMAIAYSLVYAGAVAILFLFSILLVEHRGLEDTWHERGSYLKKWPSILFIYKLLFLFDVSILNMLYERRWVAPLLPTADLSDVSATRRDLLYTSGDISKIGLTMYNQYSLLFLVTALILFVAMLVGVSIAAVKPKRPESYTTEDYTSYYVLRNKSEPEQ